MKRSNKPTAAQAAARAIVARNKHGVELAPFGGRAPVEDIRDMDRLARGAGRSRNAELCLAIREHLGRAEA